VSVACRSTKASPSLDPKKKWRLGFWSLIATQFQGAFKRNMGLKFLVIYLILAVEKTRHSAINSNCL